MGGDPAGSDLIGADINVGVLYIVAVGAIGTLGIIMAGLGSNNKYALLGALRTVARGISYEVPMVMALLVPVLLARSMSLQDIVNAQALWYILAAPMAALIFLISAIAELGRAPFDLAEAEVGDRGRLPHRIHRDEVRPVLRRRAAARPDDGRAVCHLLPGRLARPVCRAGAGAGADLPAGQRHCSYIG